MGKENEKGRDDGDGKGMVAGAPMGKGEDGKLLFGMVRKGVRLAGEDL
jgi:hypothetical protein